MDGNDPRGPIDEGSPPPGGERLRNWNGSVEYDAASVVRVQSAEQIQKIVRDTLRYPGPVRARGSHHSTTEVISNEGGTVIDLREMTRIVEIDAKAMTITLEAGVRLIDAAKVLEAMGLQFYVNIELGNLTVGSGACCGTKDASFYSSASRQLEYGQVASYAIGYKYVDADGVIREVHADDPLLPALRSSYGLLGVIFEVTFRIKTLRAIVLHHEVFEAREFAEHLDEIVRPDNSSMLYLFPFLDKVVVERRVENGGAVRTHWQWRTRNLVWEHVSPGIAALLRRLRVPGPIRFPLIDTWLRLTILLQRAVIRGSHTSPADQIIEYGERGGFAGYTFSIWAFDQKDYGKILLEYFHFCKDHYRKTGYRCDMLNVGYAVKQDRSALFSYTRDWNGLTLDPVSTGEPGWAAFITEFNQFCCSRGGKPLFNQTPGLTRCQVERAFGGELEEFQAKRRELDPRGRFYTPFFRDLFE